MEEISLGLASEAQKSKRQVDASMENLVELMQDYNKTFNSFKQETKVMQNWHLEASKRLSHTE